MARVHRDPRVEACRPTPITGRHGCRKPDVPEAHREKTMLKTLKRLSLGLLLILAAGATLLYSDRAARHRGQNRAATATTGPKTHRVALVQHASQAVLEDGVQGILEALARRGYAEGGSLSLRRYNAEGDITVANSIAKDVVGGGHDLIVTVSTASLQTVANANRTGRHTPHVFGLVSDPYGAGVGIQRTNHSDHPPYMTGYGTMQPVAGAFRLARQIRPGLRSVGLVWNPTESNSEAQTRIARAVCQELGITLVEANAENSSGVAEAAASVVARNVEALWISGDVTTLVATDAVIAAARRGRIPVFSSIPPNISKGTLFDLGANYREVGRAVGELAADVLDGKPTASIPVENLVPEMIALNTLAPAGLKDAWQFPEDLVRRADLVLDATGIHARAAGGGASNTPSADAPIKGPHAPAGRSFKVGLAYFAPEPGAEICMQGIFDGLRELGFEEGRNLSVRRTHAQAEISNIPALLQDLDSSDVDVILAMTTPVISAACSLVRHKPVVFTYCSDPVAAGVGKDFTNHLAHVTGIGSFPPVDDMVQIIVGTIPGIRSVGTVYNAAEANSRKVVEVARGVFTRAGVRLEEATVSGSSDVATAASALVARGVQAIYAQGDNTVAQAFDVLAKVAGDARLPLFNDDPAFTARGAVACVGLGGYESGRAVAAPLARVLLGESPAGIPLENVSRKALILNEALAARLGLRFPESFRAEAASQAPGKKPGRKAPATAPNPSARTRPYKVDLVEFVDSPSSETVRKGLLDGLLQSGLKEGVDFAWRRRNAQGDIATLGNLIDAAVTDDTDLIITCSTPSLQNALRRSHGRPVVFTLVANPVVAGAGRSDQDHLPFVAGAYAPSPHAEGLALLRRCRPDVQRIGTLFVPGEVNSVLYKDDLVAAARKLGIEVESVGVGSSSEVADAALAVCGRNIDAFCQISDNLTSSTFSSIVQAAARARLPLMGFASEQAGQGAFLTLARDFHENGVDSGVLAARVLRGESPASLPFTQVQKTRLTLNLAAARKMGVQVPESLIREADDVLR